MEADAERQADAAQREGFVQKLRAIKLPPLGSQEPDEVRCAHDGRDDGDGYLGTGERAGQRVTDQEIERTEECRTGQKQSIKSS